MKEPSGIYAGWIAYLQGFDYEIKVRPGVMHGNADAISRRSYSLEKDKTSIVILNNQAICELHEVSEIISLDKVKMNQELDSCYSDIIKYLCNNLVLPESEIKRQHVISVHSSYLLIDDVLYHIEVKQGKDHKKDRSTIQLAIPICMKELIFKHVHDDILSGGHMGINRTIKKARAQYFWPNMYSDIVNYVRSCERCSNKKQPAFTVRASFEPMPIPEGPWQRVSTDIFGPLPSCKETGNKYLLLFIDYFTKYAELIALPDIKAEQVARCLEDRIVCVHGPPSYLHSDRGTKYLSAIVKETCKILNIKKTETTSWHLQCNGQSERTMATIKKELQSYIDDNHVEWDRLIPHVHYIYNTTPCLDSTDYTPFFLNHGQHPRTLLNYTLENLNDHMPVRTVDYVTELMARLEQARRIATSLMSERKKRLNDRSNDMSYVPSINVGSVVYLYQPVVVTGNSSKLSLAWIGPFYVIEKLSDLHVRLRRKSENKLVKNRIHINRLKLATDRFNFDTSPPPHIDATPPAILNEDELPDMNDVNELLPDMNVKVNEYNRDAHENIIMHENVKN